MTRLSDTQAVILSAASQRDDASVLPLPETLKIRGGAVDKVLGGLKAKGLIDHLGTGRPRQPAAALDHPRRARGHRSRAGGRGRERGRRSGPKGDVAAMPAKKNKPAKGKAMANAARSQKPTPRARTKQGLMIELLKRPEGATVEQIAAATGWQHHTIRGAISGALRKKLGLTVETIRTRAVGPNKPSAKASSTVYRITG
jgi:hypothetical protein